MHNRQGWITISDRTHEKLYISSTDPHFTVTVVWDDWGADPLHPFGSQAIDAYMFRLDRAGGPGKLVAEDIFSRWRLDPVARLDVDVEPDVTYLLQLKARHVNRPLRVHVFVDGGFVAPAVPEGSVVIPATSFSSLSVGAVGIGSGVIEAYSGRGPTDDKLLRPKPEISAFDDIQSLVYSDGFTGTSAAAPVVSGFAALLLQTSPELTGLPLRDAVLRYTRAPHDKAASPAYGRGILDASLLRATGPRTPPPIGLVVALPQALGGPVESSILDRLLSSLRGTKGAQPPDPLGAELSISGSGRVPEFHYGDKLAVSGRCVRSCYYVILNRNADGVYTLVDAPEAPLAPGDRFPVQYATIVPPPGREQFALIASPAPLEPGVLAQLADGSDPGISVVIAEYEVAP